ncbi:hypothetical protein Trco_003106 [Trichoderma cornu-damae]|uniref:Uncharacterized protein n=1 Tax=Trichoderma cornu-damae TaxID=654480 RepID=A0A9P8QQQ0_9HYPO|nr:hypothetical protein Trco_003106 [Trichoderma cornu-damae]
MRSLGHIACALDPNPQLEKILNFFIPFISFVSFIFSICQTDHQNSRRAAMQRRQYRRWQGRRSQSASHCATTPARVRPPRKRNGMNTARRVAIPPYSGYNIIDWHIYNRLRSLWRAESKSWSQGERRDFAEWVPRARITEREKTIADHELALHMRFNRPSWGHFVILRAMFGASQCARQNWWANFKRKYERAAEDAPPGVVPVFPKDVSEVLQTNRMEAPAITRIPTMEVQRSHAETDCRCSWCLKNADKASRGTASASQEAGAVKAEQQPDYRRGQSIYTGEEETGEDRARRFERERGVEPEGAAPGGRDMDDEWSEFAARASCLREKSTRASADVASGSLREAVEEQGRMIEALVRLLEKQHKRLQRLAAKVERGQRKRERGPFRDEDRETENVEEE